MSNTTNYNLGKFEPTGDVYVDAVSTLGNNMDIIDGVMHESRVDLDIIRTAKITTGTATAIAVDTDGTFDLTRNGNILTIIPNVANTGTITINVDGQGAIGIRKANDAGTLVILEAGDIKQNVPTQLVRDTVNNFFVYAPRGGNPIKAWENTPQQQKTQQQAQATTARVSVSGSGWVIALVNKNNSMGIYTRLTIDGVIICGEGTTNSEYLTTGETLILIKKFNTNFTFSSSSDSIDVVYLLGDKYETALLNIYTTNTTQSTTQILNVTGKGWIFGVRCSGTQGFKLEVNGSTRYDKQITNNHPLMVRFTNGFKFSATNNSVGLDYVLD